MLHNGYNPENYFGKIWWDENDLEIRNMWGTQEEYDEHIKYGGSWQSYEYLRKNILSNIYENEVISRSSKAFDLFKFLYNKEAVFREIVIKNIQSGQIRFFNEEEWNKINSQNFVSKVDTIKEFIDMFDLGFNIGNCVGASYQLSYSYDNVDIVSGILPMIKGTRNAEKEGGHCWLETPDSIIDTSLMLVIDKSLKEELGYIEEQRLTAEQLLRFPRYQSRKDFTNDKSLRK